MPLTQQEREELVDAFRQSQETVAVDRPAPGWSRVQSLTAFIATTISMIVMVGGVWVATAVRIDSLEYKASLSIADRTAIHMEIADLRTRQNDTNDKILQRLSELSSQIAELRGDLRRGK